MPIIEVTLQAMDDDGGHLWGYSLKEVVPVAPPERGVRRPDAEAAALRLGGKLLARTDEARASIVEQVKLEAPTLGAAQDEYEREERGRG